MPLVGRPTAVSTRTIVTRPACGMPAAPTAASVAGKKITAIPPTGSRFPGRLGGEGASSAAGAAVGLRHKWRAHNRLRLTTEAGPRFENCRFFS
jgi:hypothetical protein